MKKKILALTLALTAALSLACPAFAVEQVQMENAAMLLQNLGLFQGVGMDEKGELPDFALEKTPTRAQGITMLVRLLGAEEEALAQETWDMPFLDVPDWAVPYVGYAYEKGYTIGRSPTRFDPDSPLGVSEYLSFVLRALGYSSEKDFEWDSAWTLTDKLGFTNKEYGDFTTSFTRGDMAWISAHSLAQKPKGQNKPLWQILELKDLTQDCWWEETVESCQPGRLAVSFAAVEHAGLKKVSYTQFDVLKAEINGVPCKLEQYSTSKAVKDHCKEREKELGTLDLGDAFALVYFTYDEEAAKSAATRTHTLNGVEYPILTFRLEVKGKLPNGSEVESIVTFDYYLNGYGGRL